MKSPLPTAFAILLAELVAIGGLIGLTVLMRMHLIPTSRVMSALVGLAVLALAVYPLLGVVAGIRYKEKRKALNIVGLAGNLLLFLGFVALIGYSFWMVSQVRFSRQLRGPIEVAEPAD